MRWWESIGDGRRGRERSGGGYNVEGRRGELRRGIGEGRWEGRVRQVRDKGRGVNGGRG